VSAPQLFDAKFTFTQEGDSCSVDELQTMEVSIDDAGGGHFFVIKTDRWAVDDQEQVASLLADLRIRLGDWWRVE
jgi:hypothetical protein